MLHCRFIHLELTRAVLTADTPDGMVTVSCAHADLPGAVDADLGSVSGRLAGLLPVRWDAELPLPGFSAPPVALTDVTATADSFTVPGGRLLDAVQRRR
ncbi:hypothetical protein CTZ27_11885 [Streptomyces griseocarneus]|nr:hypothetical protein CTZ27_11885 [Streptomyces griseocarneus]